MSTHCYLRFSMSTFVEHCENLDAMSDIRSSDQKVAAIKQIAYLNKVSEIKIFISMVNHFSRFIAWKLFWFMIE